MAKTYEIRPVSDVDVDGAYLLARLSLPALDLEGWREACERSRAAGAEEITVAANRRGYLQGLAISRAGPDRTLDVPSFVVVSAADEPGVGVELFHYLRARARRLNCSALRLHLADRDEIRVGIDDGTEAVEALLRLSDAASPGGG